MEELNRQFVVQFLAEIMQMTGTSDPQEAFQASLQAYVNSLRPWLKPTDGPPNPRAVFSLLENCEFEETGEYISVVFSPEAEALFHAWPRRNKIWDDAGLTTVHALFN